MPLYKTGIDMFKKYEKKFNPALIGTRFGDIRDLALERAQAGLNMVGTVRDLVRPVLDLSILVCFYCFSPMFSVLAPVFKFFCVSLLA